MNKKAKAFDTVFTLLYNAIGFMYEQDMSKEEVAEYLGTTEEILDAIDEEDIDIIAS